MLSHHVMRGSDVSKEACNFVHHCATNSHMQQIFGFIVTEFYWLKARIKWELYSEMTPVIEMFVLCYRCILSPAGMGMSKLSLSINEYCFVCLDRWHYVIYWFRCLQHNGGEWSCSSSALFRFLQLFFRLVGTQSTGRLGWPDRDSSEQLLYPEVSAATYNTVHPEMQNYFG